MRKALALDLNQLEFQSASEYRPSSIMPKSSANQSQPIYFWRESDSHTGWLSQWYYCPFKDDKNPELIYETAEQYTHH